MKRESGRAATIWAPPECTFYPTERRFYLNFRMEFQGKYKMQGAK